VEKKISAKLQISAASNIEQCIATEHTYIIHIVLTLNSNYGHEEYRNIRGSIDQIVRRWHLYFKLLPKTAMVKAMTSGGTAPCILNLNISFTPQSHDAGESVLPETHCYIFHFPTVPVVTCPPSSSNDSPQTTGDTRWNVGPIQDTRCNMMTESLIFLYKTGLNKLWHTCSK